MRHKISQPRRTRAIYMYRLYWNTHLMRNHYPLTVTSIVEIFICKESWKLELCITNNRLNKTKAMIWIQLNGSTFIAKTTKLHFYCNFTAKLRLRDKCVSLRFYLDPFVSTASLAFYTVAYVCMRRGGSDVARRTSQCQRLTLRGTFKKKKKKH